MSQLLASGGQSIGVSASVSVFPMNIKGWFPLGLTGWISFSPRDSQESFPTSQFKSINSSVLSFLYSPALTSIPDYLFSHLLHNPGSPSLKEIKPVNPKGNQPWIFIGRTDAEAEAPILWLPDTKSWHIGKDPDAGKDWRQEEKGMTENKMVVWPYQLNGHSLSKLWEMVKDREAWCCGPMEL